MSKRYFRCIPKRNKRSISFPGNSFVFIFLLISSLPTFAQDIFIEDDNTFENPLNPPIDLFIEPIDDFCLDGSPCIYSSSVTIDGGDGSGIGFWTGDCNINPQGVFDCTLCNIGTNVITYTFIENGTQIVERDTFLALFPSAAVFTVSDLICADEPAIVQADPVNGATYNWNFGNGVPVSGSDAGPWEVYFPNEGVFPVNLSITNAAGCTSNTVSHTVEVAPPLDIPEVSCETDINSVQISWSEVDHALGYSVNILQGPVGITNLWNNTYTVNNLNELDSISIEIVVEGTQPCGDTSVVQTCIARDCSSLFASAGADTVITCAEESIRLRGTGPIGANYQYFWEGPMSPDQVNLKQPLINAPGTYIFTVKNNYDGCISEPDTIEVKYQLDNLPEANTNIPDILDCKTTEVELNGENSTGPGPLTYTWSLNDSPFSQDSSTWVNRKGTYTLIVSAPNPLCRDTTRVDVFQDDTKIESVSISTFEPTCYGETNGIIYINDVQGGTPDYLYAINSGSFSSSNLFNGLSAREYQVTVLDQQDCTWDTSIVLHQPPVVEFSIGEDRTVQLGDDVNIDINTNLELSDIDTILWSPSELLDCIDDNNNLCFSTKFAPQNDILVRATIIDNEGCSYSDDILLNIREEVLIFVPNAFTPNNDGENDVLMVYGGESINYVKQFVIVDRWGVVVHEARNFQPNDPNSGWDGKLNNKSLGAGVYVYVAEVELTNGQSYIFNGDITLIK